MSLVLRPYQDEMYAEARALIQGGDSSILIQSPTGSGKTVLVAKMLKTARDRGYGSWFVVHRRELVKQSVMTMSESADVPVGIVAAGFPGNRHELIQVCSIGTLRTRREMLPRPKLVIWDEAHHTAAATWDAIHQEHPDAVHIGVTATPERLDGTGLRKYFKKLIVGPSISMLIEQGFLTDYKLFAPKPPNLDGVQTVAGDFNRKQLAAAMKGSSVTGDVINHYRKHCDGARMVLFAWSIESSIEMAARFNAVGIPAEHVDGETDNTTRDAAMENFKAGRTRILTNVDLFGEGVDVPAIEAVALLRPTRSLALFLQQIGRSLRPAPGKTHATILDHAGNSFRHGLPDDDREWTLDGRKKLKSEDGAPIKQCPACYAVMRAGAEFCRHCGFVFAPVPRPMKQVDGELEEVESKRLNKEERLREQMGAKSMDDLIKLATARGYQNPEKWARFVFNHRSKKAAAKSAAEQAVRDFSLQGRINI